MKNRRGYTLIEAVVALTILAVILSSIAAAVQPLARGDRSSRVAGSRTRVLEQFAFQFRSDAHSARRAATSEPADPAAVADDILLDFDDQLQIRYRFGTAGVERWVHQADGMRQRESFNWPLSSETHCEVRRGGRLQLAAVWLRPSPANPNGGQQQPAYRIDAAVGVSSLNVKH